MDILVDVLIKVAAGCACTEEDGGDTIVVTTNGCSCITVAVAGSFEAYISLNWLKYCDSL